MSLDVVFDIFSTLGVEGDWPQVVAVRSTARIIKTCRSVYRDHEWY